MRPRFLALLLVMFLLGLAGGRLRADAPDGGAGDACAQGKSCFPRCQCEHKACRLACFEKFKDAEDKVDPRKWEPCIDRCVSVYKVCTSRC